MRHEDLKEKALNGDPVAEPANNHCTLWSLFSSSLFSSRLGILFAGQQAKTTCTGRSWTYERVIGFKMNESLSKKRMKESSRITCMESCLNESTFECRSVNFNRETGDCYLFDVDRQGISSGQVVKRGMFMKKKRLDPEINFQDSNFLLSHPDPIDYLENNCIRGQSLIRLSPLSFHLLPFNLCLIVCLSFYLIIHLISEDEILPESVCVTLWLDTHPPPDSLFFSILLFLSVCRCVVDTLFIHWNSLLIPHPCWSLIADLSFRLVLLTACQITLTFRSSAITDIRMRQLPCLSFSWLLLHVSVCLFETRSKSIIIFIEFLSAWYTACSTTSNAAF